MSSKVIKWFIRQASFRRNSDKSDTKEKGSSSSKKNPEDKRRISLSRLSFRKRKNKSSDSPLPPPQSQSRMGTPDSTPEGAYDTSTNISEDKESEVTESPIRDFSINSTTSTESSATNSPTFEPYDGVVNKNNANSNTTKPLSEVSFHSSYDGNFRSAESHMPQPDVAPNEVQPPFPLSDHKKAKVDCISSCNLQLHESPQPSPLDEQSPSAIKLENSDLIAKESQCENEDRKHETEKQQSCDDKSEAQPKNTLPSSVEHTFDEILKLNNIDISSIKCNNTIDDEIVPMTLNKQINIDDRGLEDEECATWSPSKEVDDLGSLPSEDMNDASCANGIEYIDSEGLSGSESEDNVCSNVAGKESESESEVCTVSNLPDRSDPSTTEHVTETTSRNSSTDDKSIDVTFQSIESCNSYEVETTASVKIIVTEPSPEFEKHSVVFAPPVQSSPPTTLIHKVQVRTDDYPLELNPFGEDDDYEDCLKSELKEFHYRNTTESTNGISSGQRVNGKATSGEREASKSHFGDSKGIQALNPFGDSEDENNDIEEDDIDRFSPTNPFSIDSNGPISNDLPPRLPPKSDIPRRKANATAIPIPHPRKTKQSLHGSFTSLQSVPIYPIPAPRILTPTSSTKNLHNDGDGYFQKNVDERSSLRFLSSSSSQEDFSRNEIRGSVPANQRVRIGKKKRPAPLPPGKGAVCGDMNKPSHTQIVPQICGEALPPPGVSSGVNFFSLPRKPGSRDPKKQQNSSPSYISRGKPPPRPPPPRKSLS